MMYENKLIKTKCENLRKAILNEKIPEYLSVNRRREEKRNRVLVKSIADLEEYCSFIDILSKKYAAYYGHKKTIGELLGVSTNRIGEWQRIWNAASQEYSSNSNILMILKNKENSLVQLLQALKQAGWQQTKNIKKQNAFNDKTKFGWLYDEKNKRLKEEIQEGEKSVADPLGRLDFVSSALGSTFIDESFDSICALMEPPNKIRRIDTLNLSNRYNNSNLDDLSPFEYQL